MAFSEVLFYEEKKSVITNILDTAVKKFNFAQKDYVKIKASLMHVIEKKGNEKVGLGKVVNLTNLMISKVADHSGYVIVESDKHDEADSAPSIEIAIDECASHQSRIRKAEPSNSTEKVIGKAVQVGIARNSGERRGTSNKPTSKGKENLLKLVRFLPPLISPEEMELFSARIRNARIGPATGAIPARTTGDLEKELVSQLVDEYSHIYDDLAANNKAAFVEKTLMSSGRTRNEDVSEKLRKQLVAVQKVAEFLSIKDVVERLVKDYGKPKNKGHEGSKLFFWRKK